MKVSFKAVVLSDEFKTFTDRDGTQIEKHFLYVNQKGDKDVQKIAVPKDFKFKVGELLDFECELRPWAMNGKSGVSIKTI